LIDDEDVAVELVIQLEASEDMLVQKDGRSQLSKINIER
jgi:hypothetical protein